MNREKERSFGLYVQLQQNIISHRDVLVSFNSAGFPKGPLKTAYNSFADFSPYGSANYCTHLLADLTQFILLPFAEPR
jgi:hypothetical protein